MNIIKIPLSKIKIKDRSRTEFGELGALAESIKKLGLIQPLVVEDLPDGIVELRAGERRLKALELLKWDSAPCVLFSNLTPLQKLEVELEENIKRKDFSWQEEVVLKAKIDEELKKLKPSWTIADTADKIGVSLRTLNNDIALAKALKTNPTLISDEKDKSNAYRKVCRDTQVKVRALEAKATASITGKSLDQRLNSVFKDKVTIVNSDCFDLLSTIPDESIDLIITDPPYGIDLANKGEFGDTWDTHWDDTEKALKTLLPNLFSEFRRVLKNGAHFYIFMPYKTSNIFITEAEKTLTIQHLPLIWNKVNRGSCLNPFSLYAANYELILYGWKHTARKFSKPGDCVLTFPSITTQKLHPTQKPVELIKYLIEQSSISDETILDPFAGSGTTAVAAVQTNRKFIGSELVETYYNITIERLLNEFNPDPNSI